MRLNSMAIADYLCPRMNKSSTAIRQQLGKAGAVAGTELVNGGLLNVYDIDLLIEHFEDLLANSSLVTRHENLWQDYIKYLEEIKYDLYRCP